MAGTQPRLRSLRSRRSLTLLCVDNSWISSNFLFAIRQTEDFFLQDHAGYFSDSADRLPVHFSPPTTFIVIL